MSVFCFIVCQNINFKFTKIMFSVNLSPELENKNFRRCKSIFFEHLQELIWITHSRNSGFVRFRFVNLFERFLTF